MPYKKGIIECLFNWDSNNCYLHVNNIFLLSLLERFLQAGFRFYGYFYRVHVPNLSPTSTRTILNYAFVANFNKCMLFLLKLRDYM